MQYNGDMSNIYKPKGTSLEAQYYDLGRKFCRNLQLDIDIEKNKMAMVNRVLANVNKVKKLNKFYKCFVQWAKGAGISAEKAMYLLADNTSGCQTAMVRYASGVALLHTEEDYYDIELRMGKVHTTILNDKGRELACLVYNDLMPGAGLYGWQSNMIVAVDSLFLREEGMLEIERPMLANIVAWYIWYTDPTKTSISEVIEQCKSFGELVDGYAINLVIKSTEKIVEGYRLSCARNVWEVTRLGKEVNAQIVQTNIVDPKYMFIPNKIVQYQTPIWRMAVDYFGFLMRMRMMRIHISEYHQYTHTKLARAQLRLVHNFVQSIIYGKYRSHYVTEWMGAMCVGVLDTKLGTSVSMRRPERLSSRNMEYLSVMK